MKPTMLKFCMPALVCGFAVALVAGTTSAAHAQGIGGPTSLSVGGFWPSSGQAKYDGGTTQIDADLRWHVPVHDNPITMPARTVLDVGVEAGADHGNHDTIVPVTIGEDLGLNNKSPLAPNNAYVGVGVGAYFENMSGLSSQARLGGYVSVGYNFTHAVFLEGKYQWAQDADGPMLNVGYRF